MISFSKIPTNLRVPFVFSEIDPTGANQARTPYKGLIAAQMTTNGSRAAVVATSAATVSGNTLTFASAPAIQNVKPGMTAIDRTTTTAIPAGITVLSIAGAVVTVSGALTGVLIADSIEFYDLTPTNMNSQTNASALFGPGSQIARMYRQWRANNSFGEVWVLPLADDPAAAAATGTIVFAGTATTTGTFFLMVGGVEIPVIIANAMTAAQAATAAAAAINANKDLPVTAAAVTATVTITAKNRGLAGNSIDLRTNYFGLQSGEVDVPGLLYTVTAMAGGTTNPSVGLAAGLAGLPPYRWGYVATPYGTDTNSLNAQRDWMSDTVGQWAWLSMQYGHVFTAQMNSLGTLQTNGAARNDQHLSIMGIYDSPTPPEEWAAQIAAAVQQRLDADPGANLDGIALPGVLAPRGINQFHLSDQNTLLWNGISTFKVVAGQVSVQKLITTYQLNQFGSADDSFLEPETLYRVAYALSDLKADLETNFAGARLAPDGTRFGPNVKVVTPKLATARAVTRYSAMEDAGIVVNTAGFAKAVSAEIDANNPRRLDMLWPGVIIHDLDIIAILARLNG